MTRIIFCQAIGEKNWNKATGVGISTSIGDNEYDINVVDIPAQRVFTMPEVKLKDGQVPLTYKPDKDCVWSFEEYIARKPVEA